MHGIAVNINVTSRKWRSLLSTKTLLYSSAQTEMIKNYWLYFRKPNWLQQFWKKQLASVEWTTDLKDWSRYLQAFEKNRIPSKEAAITQCMCSVWNLINKLKGYGMIFACEVWCTVDFYSLSTSSEQTEGLWGNQCLNSGYRFIPIEKSGFAIGWVSYNWSKTCLKLQERKLFSDSAGSQGENFDN